MKVKTNLEITNAVNFSYNENFGFPVGNNGFIFAFKEQNQKIV